jgi:hypothetical protein
MNSAQRLFGEGVASHMLLSFGPLVHGVLE